MIALPLMRKALQQAPNGVLSEEKAEEVLKTCMKVLFYRDARSINKVRWPTTYALSLLHADESSAFPVPNRKSDKERSGHLGQHERGYLLAICRQIARVRCSDAVIRVTNFTWSNTNVILVSISAFHYCLMISETFSFRKGKQPV